MKTKKKNKNKKLVIVICTIVVVITIAVTAILLTRNNEEELNGTVVDISSRYDKIANYVIEWDSSTKEHDKPMIKETAKCSIAQNNEVHNYEDINECWIDANTTYKNKGELEFTLYADWIAEDGIFGEDKNSYINGKGGLLIKNWTSNLIINFNGYKIDRNLTGNTVTYGSVIKIDESSNVYFTNGYITGGANTDDGGGVLIYGKSHVHFENMTVSGNISGYNGGGIYVGSHAYLYLDNTFIEGNYAEHRGGGVYCDYMSSGSAREGNRIDGADNVVTIQNNIASNGYYNLTLESIKGFSAHIKDSKLTDGSSIYVSVDADTDYYVEVVSYKSNENDKYFYLDNSESCKFMIYERCYESEDEVSYGIKCNK